MQKLLIVEDEPILLDMLSTVVSTAGYEVVGATSFDQAKRLIETAEPDLIIVDVRLGAYNGLHLVVRHHLTHPGSPIIITTGYPDPSVIAEAGKYGAEFLEKPIRSADLLALVRRLLERPRPQ